MSEALAELERAAASPPLTDAERPSARAWASFACLSMGDLQGASAAAEEARTASRDPLTTSIAVTTLASVSEQRGHLRDALDIAETALSLADQSPGRLGHRYPVHVTSAHVLIELDQFEHARAALESGWRISEELGIRWSVASYQAYFAVAEVEASTGLAEETGETYSLILSSRVQSLICLHRNDLTRAAKEADVAAGQLAHTGARWRAHWALLARALSLEADGKIADAFVTLAECWDLCAQSDLTLEYRVIGADLVRLALVCGDTGRARAAAAGVTELAARNDVPSLTGAALPGAGRGRR